MRKEVVELKMKVVNVEYMETQPVKLASISLEQARRVKILIMLQGC